MAFAVTVQAKGMGSLAEEPRLATPGPSPWAKLGAACGGSLRQEEDDAEEPSDIPDPGWAEELWVRSTICVCVLQRGCCRHVVLYTLNGVLGK